MELQLPYHCLQRAGSFLFAAAGSHIDAFALNGGTKKSSWTCPVPPSSKKPTHDAEILAAKSDGHTGESAGEELLLTSNPQFTPVPPAKKRKLSEARDTSTIAPETKKGKSYSSSKADNEPTNILALASASGGHHLVAVTAEDKTVRVFEHDGMGRLTELSKRLMPKRPCAIAVTADDQNIIIADKFGDVYALPLLEPAIEQQSIGQSPKSTAPPLGTPSPFKSAANNLTVHSKRNLRALQNQLLQTQQRQEKLDAHPGQELLLGHVSMLTDIVLSKDAGRDYIITADRDEHIRVSRGMPQTHVIEGFCLEHTDFVSRLCIPKSKPEYLISGGGDGLLLIWNWKLGQLVARIDLKSEVQQLRPSPSPERASDVSDTILEDLEPAKVVISAIKDMEAIPNTNFNFIAVSCEGVPAIFWIDISETQGPPGILQTVLLDCNPLSIEAGASASLIVAVDHIHTAGSTTQLRDEQFTDRKPLRALQFIDSKWEEGPVLFEIEPHTNEPHDSLLGLWYNLENLRKRGSEED